jgi:hypothetical protein
MRGLPDYNFPAFAAAAHSLRDRGWDVWSPAESDADEGGPEAAAADIKCTLVRDITALAQCAGIVLLPGWMASSGACLERHFADTVGLDVFLWTEEEALVRVPHRMEWRLEHPRVTGIAPSMPHRA